jgi:ribosome biogenesis GTPase A
MDIERKKIQWYPGHMAKAGRQIGEKLKLIDVVIEVLDARVPRASRNPGISKMLKGRRVSHVILLNKADLADPGMTRKWTAALLDAPGTDAVLPFTAFDGKAKKRLIDTLDGINTSKKSLVKCLLCGIPNVGKSAIINTLAGKKKAQTGNKPGVTRGQQWIQTEANILFLDTPGILWPKFEDDVIGTELAWIGSIKDTIFEKENLAGDLMQFMVSRYPKRLAERYRLDVTKDKPVWQLFDELCESKKLLMRGNQYDYARASQMLLTDFKNGKLGRITIDDVKG